MTRYNVTTYDADLRDYTPQEGVNCTNLDIFGLKRCLRELKDLGYSCDYSKEGGGDPSVIVERI